jgi:DNA-binding LytR/AlgR family response regulator
MRCLVVDSSLESARSLSTLLLGEADVQLLGCWRTLSDAAGAIDRDRPEVLFLDMDAASDLLPPLVPAAPVSLVALTGGPDGAVAAFRLGAIDCLQKPATLERLREALTRARSRRTLASQAELCARILAGTPAAEWRAPSSSRFVIKERHATRILEADAVTWFEAQGNYVCLHVYGGRGVMQRGTMGKIQTRAGSAFVRIHRSALVRGALIRELCHHPRGWQLVLADGTTLPVGRRYLRTLKQYIADAGDAGVGRWPLEEQWR